MLSHVPLFAPPGSVARQGPLATTFSRQEYWSGLPFPSAGDLPHPGIQSGSPALQADSLLSETPEALEICRMDLLQELVHTVLEDEKSYDLLSINWRNRKASGVNQSKFKGLSVGGEVLMAEALL